MFTKKNDTNKDKDLDLKLKLFAELVRLWAHADAYLWNRARTIVGVQGAVLAGGWFLLQTCEHWLMQFSHLPVVEFYRQPYFLW